MQVFNSSQEANVYTVSELNHSVKLLLENGFASIWIEGEISNFTAPHSGHWYFSLKDSEAQVRCAMFRMYQKKVGLLPKNGMHVLVKARVSLYENRGEFQLIVEELEERGEGKLRLAFDILKKKLQAMGMFDEAHKKSLPTFPQTIGVITSATGAAIRDILSVLKRRHPCVSIIIYPALVQGSKAAISIVSAIQIANQRKECDVLILARGGGSLEDLWPFNEEPVALAIHQSTLPIISGIGHEIDVAIADFVADLRAPTPSAAAELAAPDCMELIQLLTRYSQQLKRQIDTRLQHLHQKMQWIEKHLFHQHPKRKLMEKMQQLDYFQLTLNKLQINHITSLKTQLAQYAATLEALSPLATLQRGYAIVTRPPLSKSINTKQDPAKIIKSAQDLALGETVEIKLHQGSLGCLVIDIK